MIYEIVDAVRVSLLVSIFAVLLSTSIALPFGYLIGINEFRYKRFLCVIFYSLVSIPTTVIGLLFYSLFSRDAVFGVFDLLYTPYIMILGQTVLIFPMIVAQSISLFQNIDENIKITAYSLGIKGTKLFFLLLHEFKEKIAGITLIGFGRAISEVGVAMMIGGNIKFYTRTITTTMLTEIGKGKFTLCLFLGLILLFISVIVNFLTWKFVSNNHRKHKDIK